ncbi:MAG: Re/Si-specific NAD(P)(+) transhydrogenase subunit alpha [Gemmatirosa sp.]|nr:Re/Si-specific NAD(P)(+) transhydrogenase subunit alpha [Gemmatirosa sp.]
MRIGILKETAEREHRVVLVPESVKTLVAAGHEVVVERGAGMRAHFPDALYTARGATIVDDAAAAARGAHVVAKVQRPTLDEASLLDEGSALVSLLQPAQSAELLARLAERRVTAFALELVPRITRAQSMDVLSSQATIAGYKAVLLGAAQAARLLPMLTTAAGTITPAKAFVIGAGVAGLQAIATARRLGAVVSAFDIRPAAREQVQSLGASFVAAEQVAAGAETAGGYAREQSADEQARTAQALANHIKDMDLVVSTASVPGRPAPRLISEEMVASMRPGSVIVDLSAENGGNCALTRPGETIVVNDVVIIGPLNLPASVPFHASQMLSKNVLTFLQHVTKEGALSVDVADEITGAMAVTHAGEVRRS